MTRFTILTTIVLWFSKPSKTKPNAHYPFLKTAFGFLLRGFRILTVCFQKKSIWKLQKNRQYSKFSQNKVKCGVWGRVMRIWLCFEATFERIQNPHDDCFVISNPSKQSRMRITFLKNRIWGSFERIYNTDVCFQKIINFCLENYKRIVSILNFLKTISNAVFGGGVMRISLCFEASFEKNLESWRRLFCDFLTLQNKAECALPLLKNRIWVSFERI